MKNINETIVWISVKFSNFFKITATLLIIISLLKPTENKDLIIILCILIWCALIVFINTRPDESYRNLWPSKTEDENVFFELRGKSLCLPAFIAGLILFTLTM